jgi:Cytochrome P450
MVIVLGVIGGSLAVASLPYWLPRSILALRMRIFTRINGEEGIAVPGALVGASQFKQVYSDKAANGRSKGAALSDLFWYWLSPGPEIHQEHLEPGERYEEVARATRGFLALPKRRAEELASHCVARVFGSMGVQRRPRLVRLRDPMMQVWAEFYYQVVFGEHCPPAARALIVANANDVVTALKCCGLRHMRRRRRLTEFLLAKVKAGELAHPLPAVLSTEEQALYLQGVFFNTAIVQMSEAMAHLIMVLAQHQRIQKRLVAEIEDDRLFDRIISETLRQYPLFGIAHRITSEDIAVDDRTTISKGSVLCFNYPDYHRIGFDDPDRFDPDRWEKLSGREATYIPFGVTANRPCPAQALALVTMRATGREILKRFACYSSAAHTRSIPNRGPCLLVSRAGGCNPLWRHVLLFFMAVRDRWEDVWRSVVQLVLGTYMVWHARRLRLCQRYFDRERCPVGGHVLPD